MHEGYNGNETGLTPEQLLNSEHGMFLIDLRERVLPEVENVIGQFNVEEDVKVACREIFKGLESKAAEQVAKERDGVYDTARAGITKLMDLLDCKGEEKSMMFEYLRNLILQARNSALGWEWPPKRF